MTSKKIWRSNLKELSLLCQIMDKSERPDFLGKFIECSGVSSLGASEGASWSYFDLKLGSRTFHCALFVRKLIITFTDVPSGTLSLSETLKFSLEIKKDLLLALQHLVDGLDIEVETRSYLVVGCDSLQTSKMKSTTLGASPDWVGDGLTTFALRAFDSRRNRSGVIRISRHLTICYGLTDELTTDVNNLIYEKILYGGWPTSADDIFGLMDALGKYVLPTELSLYTHRIASKLATYAVAIGILFSAIGFIQSAIVPEHPQGVEVFYIIALYLSFCVLAAVLWSTIGKLSERYIE